MSRNDATYFTDLLYSRVPAMYRAADREQGLPLLALLRVIGTQAANLRQDLDALWDNFFIETCDDWAVPYIGALVGANLLAKPVGQSNRFDVRNTVIWRRHKGSPRMLRELAQATTEWPTELAEFFQSLGWSQNVNHLRLDHPLTSDLRDPYRLGLLGRASDPFAHAADFKPARPLDQPRVTLDSLGIGRTAWGTPGRYQIRNVGFSVRRLRTFPINGATPAAAPPGVPNPPDAACLTFDPLFREVPLFKNASGEPLSRTEFNQAPWRRFGTDVAVRKFGVLLASDARLEPNLSSSSSFFNFGGRGAGLSLDTTRGIRLLDIREFVPGVHFVITAEWHGRSGITNLGSYSTRLGAFRPGQSTTESGRFALRIDTGRFDLDTPFSPEGRFPGAVIAVRAAQPGLPRASDALLLYLPAAFVTPTNPVRFYIASDGSAYTEPDLRPTSLARSAEGQSYPPSLLRPGTAPADEFRRLTRTQTGLVIPDPSRLGAAQVMIRVNLFTGAFQPLGAIATIPLPSVPPQLHAPSPWPALTYAPSRAAMDGNLSEDGLLSVQLIPLSGDFVPASEIVVQNRAGRGLLIYLPESAGLGADGIHFLVAEDGSTYDVPLDALGRQQILQERSFRFRTPARLSAGQVLPIPGVIPLQQRRPVAVNLCRCERRTLLREGELGIDPELGRFAFAPDDPDIGAASLTVDYSEAFSDRVGALNFDRQLDSQNPATRLVSRSGDAESTLASALPGAPVYRSVAAACAAALSGDVIEIVDSATYTEPSIALSAEITNIIVRAAAGERPCLVFYDSGGAPLPTSLRVASPMDRLEMNGLLISGGPLMVDARVKQLWLIASTIDPRVSVPASLIVSDNDLNARAHYTLCRCVTGRLRLGNGVERTIIADSVVDGFGTLAIGGFGSLASPPLEPAAATIQLERVTVLGRVRCEVLHASNCLLDDVAIVEDRQSGCIRFTRYEPGSVLPRRYQSIPYDEQASKCSGLPRCLAPLFNSRRYGRPDYVQLAAACPPEILTASEESSEVGAFAGALNTVRLGNLQLKLQEFMPAGLSAVVVGET